MTKFVPTLSMAVALLAGCASGPTPHLVAGHPEKKAQIQRRLDEIFHAAERKDWERLDAFHFYGPKFTKFGSERPGRQYASETQELEHAGLGAVEGMSMRASDLKIDVFGGVGIATFILDYSFKQGSDTIEKKARSTMVFVDDQGSWRIAHEHFSTFLDPDP